MSNIFNVENTIQPISDDFSTDGTLDDFARIDHQHALSPSLLKKIVNSVASVTTLPSAITHSGELWLTRDTFIWYYSNGISWFPFAGNINLGSNRNLIDNGAMIVAQRPVTAGVIGTGWYPVDRWQHQLLTLGAWTEGQSTTVPVNTGLGNSLNFTVTTIDAAPAAGDYSVTSHSIEGIFLQHLLWGTSLAKSLTLSFWVRGTTIGTYIAELVNFGAATRTISASYTILAANTWEYKTITFPGDTVQAITNDTSTRVSVYFWFAAGSNYTSGVLQTTWATIVNANRVVGQVNLAATVNNNIFITGVQLEIGTKNTAFEHRPFDVEYQKAMRYFEKSYEYAIAPGAVATAGALYGVGRAISTTSCDPGPTIWFKVKKRIVPTMAFWRVDGTANAWLWNGGNAAVIVFRNGQNSIGTYATGLVGLTIGQAVATDGHWQASAEI